MLYQAEYRWEPRNFWELSVFTDTGTVSESDSKLSFSTLNGIGDSGRVSKRIGTSFFVWR